MIITRFSSILVLVSKCTINEARGSVLHGFSSSSLP
jgi:hypothetical protein